MAGHGVVTAVIDLQRAAGPAGTMVERHELAADFLSAGVDVQALLVILDRIIEPASYFKLTPDEKKLAAQTALQAVGIWLSPLGAWVAL